MSIEIIKQVIARAVAEPDYREMLLTDPGTALGGCDLTQAEKESLNSLTRENFDALAGQLEDRLSRAGLDINPFGDGGGVDRGKITGVHKSTDVTLK